MKKYLVVFLVFLLVLSCFSFPVFADDGNTDDELTFWQKVTAGLTNIIDSLKNGFTNVTDFISIKLVELKDALYNRLGVVVQWLNAISNTLDTRLLQIVTWFGDLNETLANRLKSVITWLGDIHNTLSTRLSSVVSWLGDINSNIGYHINKLFGNIKGLFDSSVDADESPIDDSVDDLIDVENQLTDQTDKGFDEIPGIISSAKSDILAYVSAFTAIAYVLDMFFNLHFFSSLLYISLAFGLFALITNMVPSLAKAGSRDSKGGKF